MSRLTQPLASAHPPAMPPLPTGQVPPLPAPAAPAAQLWRDGKVLMVPAGLEFPDLCVKCGTPSEGRRKKLLLRWHEPWIYLLILPGVLIYAIVATILSKKATLHIGYCKRCAGRRVMLILIGVGLLLAGIGGFVMAGVMNHGGFAAFGGLAFLVGLIWAVVATPVLKPDKIDEWGNAWVKGAHATFLDMVPQVPK